MPRSPNPEAIAWYVAKSEGLLDEIRREIAGLQARAGRLAGFSGAVLALAGANAESVVEALHGTTREFAGSALLLGCFLLVVALATALRGALFSQPRFDGSRREVANYATERFIAEPDLWRVHVRTLHGLLAMIEVASKRVDRTTRAMEKSEYFFLSGLFSVGLAFATLIGMVTF
jgi:hypothetical protein